MQTKRWVIAVAKCVIIVGCSKAQQEQANQALDCGTGKTNVETYQRTKDQLRAIRDQEA